MKRSVKTGILCVILLCLLAFIWGQSTLSASDSLEESGAVRRWVTPFLEIFFGRGNVTDHTVRKLAHFLEYTALGAVLCLLVPTRQRKQAFYLSYAFLLGVFIAVLDESIQLLAEERGSQVQDILLDGAGVLTGLLFGELLSLLWHRIQTGKKKS